MITRNAALFNTVVNWDELPVTQVRPGVRRRVYATDEVMICHHELEVGMTLNPHRHDDFGRTFEGDDMAGIVNLQAAAVLMLWCGVAALMADARAASLERVEFESASTRLYSGVGPTRSLKGSGRP